MFFGLIEITKGDYMTNDQLEMAQRLYNEWEQLTYEALHLINKDELILLDEMNGDDETVPMHDKIMEIDDAFAEVKASIRSLKRMIEEAK